MSYILDALRRSQAERERGQVPGLNAQPSASSAAPPVRRPVPAAWWVAGVAVLVGGGVAGWLLRTPAMNTAAPGAPVPTTVPRTESAPAALPQVVSVPSPTTTTAAAPPALPPAPRPPTPAATPQTPVAAASQPAAPVPAARLPLLSELPADQRRELPPLVLGGSIWSESVLSRFVIVNGQVVREGEAAAPGVTVERIAPKAVVLRWRELRFEVPL